MSRICAIFLLMAAFIERFHVFLQLKQNLLEKRANSFSEKSRNNHNNICREQTKAASSHSSEAWALVVYNMFPRVVVDPLTSVVYQRCSAPLFWNINVEYQFDKFCDHETDVER